MKPSPEESSSVPDDDEIRKLTVRKLRLEALKLRAETSKVRAEAQSAKPVFSFLKYTFAGLVAGVSCYLLFSKVVSDLYSMTSSQKKEAKEQLDHLKKESENLKTQKTMVDASLKEKQEEIKKKEEEIAAAKLESAKLAEASKALSDQFTKNEKLIFDMRDDINRRIKEGELNNMEKARLKEQEKSLSQALEAVRQTIPQRANDTQGYIRIGQLDPRGYFISGKSAIGGNPALENLRVGQEYIVAIAHRVRVSLPRNDNLYHEGVAPVGLLSEGEAFLITEGPTVYFRNEERDVWVGIRRPAAVAPRAVEAGAPPGPDGQPDPPAAPSTGGAGL